MHQPTSAQTNNHTFSTQQTRRVEHRQQQQNLHPQAHPHFLSPPHSLDMQEAIQREIEKEQIREEILISDIVRRRVLEAEVRRELMVERELALRRGDNPFGPSPIADLPMGFPFLWTRSEGSSLEGRFAFSITERERSYERGRIDSLPFHRQPAKRSADLAISEVKPVLEGNQENEQIKLGTPDENISGSKRKAPSSPSPSPPGVDATESRPDTISTKKARQDWSCDICQVSATCENGLSEHLQGKKHKSREAAVRDQRAGKNFCLGLQPKIRDKTVVETISKTCDDFLPPNETAKSDNSKKNQSQKEQKNADPKKKKYRFWCEICQVGTRSETVMNDHKRGKKHMGRLERCQESMKEEKGSEKKAVTVELENEKEEKPGLADLGEMSSGHEKASSGEDTAVAEEFLRIVNSLPINNAFCGI